MKALRSQIEGRIDEIKDDLVTFDREKAIGMYGLNFGFWVDAKGSYVLSMPCFTSSCGTKSDLHLQRDLKGYIVLDTEYLA